MHSPTDIYGRRFKTLRVSLTSTCNLGCVYCVDETADKAAAPPAQKPLSAAQFADTIAALHGLLGLDTVRLTGGEPTLYRDLLPLMQGIRAAGVPAIKMTTNGYLLAPRAQAYAAAGLTGLNISLDAVEPEAFYRISRRRNLHKVVEGIDRAVEAGLDVKLNCVVMRGLNDDQLLPLLEFARERGIAVRFLELMQMGHLHGDFAQHFVPQHEILHRIAARTGFEELPRAASATATYWQLPDGYRFGIIANESDPFCHDCNRLRLDSYGNVYGCLSDNTPIPLADALPHPDRLHQRLAEALAQKKTRFSGSPLSMLAIGG